MVSSAFLRARNGRDWANIGYSTGGLSIVGGGGKIDINNTFEERLKLLQDTALPSIRTTLFGKNENRKFYE